MFAELWKFSLYQNDTLTHGLVETNKRFLVNFAITFFILIAFATMCSFVLLLKPNYVGIGNILTAIIKLSELNTFIFLDWTRTKQSFAISGIITALLATLSSFGLMLLLGWRYNAILTVMPFLLICKQYFVDKLPYSHPSEILTPT